jgi:hypothetical protein
MIRDTGSFTYRWDDLPESAQCFSVNEIWLGSTEAEDGPRDGVPLFVDERHQTRAGLFGEVQAGKVGRRRLIAEVRAPADDLE